MIVTKRRQTTEDLRPTTLYVVFHGEIILLDDKVSNYIVAVAPRIRSHIYQAGPWLGELKIEPGAVLLLGGVNTGKKCIFENTERMLLIDQVPGSADANWHFLLILPRPHDVLPGLVLNLERGTLNDLHPPGVVLVPSPGKDYPTGVDAHPVFRYTVPVGKKAAIYDAGGSAKDPLFKPGAGQPNCLSLHISAEEDRTPTKETADCHAAEAFNAVKAFLGIEANFNPKGQGDVRPPILIPGLDPAEYTMPMAIRTDFLRQIGEQQRLGATPDLAEVFREKWTLAGGYAPHQEPTHWFPEGTCGSTGARLAGNQTTMGFLRKIRAYDGPEDPSVRS